jgi:sugar phosphate isomerase/epimerase
MPKNPISIQMYTLRDQVAADIAGVLRAVAELGYGAVELHSFGNLSAAQVRAELDTLGLQASGMHVGLDRLERQLDAAIADMRTIGARHIVCPAAPLDRRESAEGYRSLAQTLNRIGRECQAQGLQLGYHNHNFEFQRFGDQTGYDILFAETDPALVKAELDVYWAAFAGQDPVALIRNLGSRVPLVHLKDMAAGSRAFAEVGHGTLDFPSILAACDDAGVEWLIVEQDRCERPPLESVGMSLAYLRSLGRT